MEEKGRKKQGTPIVTVILLLPDGTSQFWKVLN
jgi:hypothetical protein